MFTIVSRGEATAMANGQSSIAGGDVAAAAGCIHFLYPRIVCF